MARNKFTPEEIAEKKDQLKELRRLRAMGAKQVTHGDKSVILKSDAELQQAIEDLERDLRGSYKTRVIKTYPVRGY